MNINTLTFNNFKKIDQGNLADPGFFAKVEDFVYEIESEGNPDIAKEVFLTLSTLLDQAPDKDLMKKYLPILCALRLISLLSVSDDEKQRFLSENIVILLKQDYADLKFWLSFLFNAYMDDKDIQKQLQAIFVTALTQSNSLLGDQDIQITSGKVKPFVKNWIFDYNVTVPYKNKKRKVPEETMYINQSSNTKQLIADKRIILLKLLDLYDWLRFEIIDTGEQVKIEDLYPEPQRKEITQKIQAVKPQPSEGIINMPKPVGEFDEMLAQASHAPAHGQDLEALKKRLEQNKENIPSVAPKPIPAPAVKMTADEIKREVATPELPSSHLSDLPTITAPQPKFERKVTPPHEPDTPPAWVVQSETPVRPFSRPSSAPMLVKSINDVKTIDDLKKITVGNLRQGPQYAQTQLIKTKIITLARANNLLPYYAVNAFEQSPLFKSYLAMGSAMVAGTDSTADLSQQEFEAIADLRKEIERL